MNRVVKFRTLVILAIGLWSLPALVGCGTTKSQQATEQLLMSNAVDMSVSKIDFRPLAGFKVYLDTTYLKNVRGFAFVNADYIISSLRQQMAAANCLLQDKPTEADVVVEARVGALGTDSHDVTYGLPANKALSAASTLISSIPTIPVFPEISVARKADQRGAAKIVVFAYDRESRRPIWQSGLSLSRSTASDTWVLGAGPFQRGTIYDHTHFAGSELSLPSIPLLGPRSHENQSVAYDRPHVFEPAGLWWSRLPEVAAEPEEDASQALRMSGPYPRTSAAQPIPLPTTRGGSRTAQRRGEAYFESGR
jgi:hypothetical protein